MKSLGKSYGSTEVNAHKENVSFPTVTIDMNRMKELDDMDVGDECMMLMKCKMTGKNIYGNGEKNCTLELMEADCVEDTEEKEEDEE